MKNRENILSLLRRTGYERAPFDFELCPSLQEDFARYFGTRTFYRDFLDMPITFVTHYKTNAHSVSEYKRYYSGFDGELTIDDWGVGHAKGSAAAKHMTRLISPLKTADAAEIAAYPLPTFENICSPDLIDEVASLKKRDKVSFAFCECTIWETSWYLRGMEELMMDMLVGEESARILLDRVTDVATQKAVGLARSGVDILFLGDDIGMQSSIMMSVELYREWLKPRMKQLIERVREVRPDILIRYHSCGYIEPFIPDLIEIGVDILNPVQPESMSFEKLHAEYGDKLSFYGTIGTQTTMPFGTKDEIQEAVWRNLSIAGAKGGLVCCPTHLLEPEVPIENILTYMEAIKQYV